MSAVISCFVYISRHRNDAIDRIIKRDVLSLFLHTKYLIYRSVGPLLTFVTSSLTAPLLFIVNFILIPCLLPCKLAGWKRSSFKCCDIGHISLYWSASDKCAWCAVGHATYSSCQYHSLYTHPLQLSIPLLSSYYLHLHQTLRSRNVIMLHAIELMSGMILPSTPPSSE